jgi:hypothetical protein
MLDLPAPLRMWHLTSMDAPTVALVWSLSFAWAMRVRLPSWIPLLLVLGTWTAYVGDRLLDALMGFRSGDCKCLRERHYFHWRHRRILLALAACACFVVIAIIFKAMPLTARNPDSFLAVAALAYFSGVHYGHRLPGLLRKLFSKELLVGALFAAGCALPTFSRLRLSSNAAASLWPLIVVAVFFAAVAWLNCHAIEHWESEDSSSISFAAATIGLAGLVLVWLIAPILSRTGALLAAGTASALLIALLDSTKTRLTPLALRVLADVVLLTPILAVWFGPRA